MAKLTSVPISIAGQYGIIVDVSPQEMPLNAWTSGKNVRMRDGFVEKFLGHVEVFAGSPIASIWAMPVNTVSGRLWMHAGTNKVYTWDGVNHVNITRQTSSVDVDYSANETINWNGGVLGGIPVINNGVDTPQQWFPANNSTKLEELANWPADTLCRVIRPFKQYLIALDVTKTSTRYPYMVKWSHAADPGDVPVSWDETDETRDAGEAELKETDGFLIDCARLGEFNIIYKEDSVIGQQYIGGINIFRFYPIFDTIGALSRHCVVGIPGRQHALFGSNDVIKHNGVEAVSLLDSKWRRRLYSTIDSDNYFKSFAVANKAMGEVWFCFPETGNSRPNIALVWNVKSGALGLRDLPNSTFIASGQIDLGVDADTWSNDDGDWSSWSTVWDERATNPTQEKLLIVDPTNSKFFRADTDSNFAGSAMEAYVERVGLGFPLKNGQPPDFTTRKFVNRIWPRITGTIGGIVNVSLGVQDKIDGPVTYKGTREYVIGSSAPVDLIADGRLHAIKFASNTSVEWQLHGYEVEVRRSGGM